MSAEIVPYAKTALDEVALTGYGLLSWTGNPENGRGASSAAATQVIFAVAIPLRAGMSVSNIWFGVQTAGTSTAPTGFFLGLANATTVLAQTANQASSGTLTATGFKSLPLSAAYAVPADGIYYVLILQNGIFAGTNVLFQKADPPSGATLNSVFVIATGGTGQTALPANGNAITLASTSSPLTFWAGVS